ncbi:unnamed protein product [Caenorhabditis bovis]|uniref:SXP/RAL-2 family protein Ani s 5-like cation-binding domain-containing protein n=1 Tax=Caenorhabditis bovis TaxID=2654633 RepID=A0A8S1FEA0_9PELO|nr:unnamed protein product [Caenorhabditis bovis]
MLSHNQLVVLSVLLCAVSAHPGARGGPHGGRGFAGPNLPFLQSVSDEARQEFFKIVSNRNLTINEIESQSAQWAQTNGVADIFNEFNANKTALEAATKQNVSQIIANLPTVQSSLQRIFENKDQTSSQILEALNNAREQYPQEVHVLLQLSQPQGPRGPHGPPPRHFNNGKKDRRQNNKKNNNKKNKNQEDDEEDNE